jgi:acyl-CoA reductase-like NAD-dependent aldehyde dehydrogenase
MSTPNIGARTVGSPCTRSPAGRLLVDSRAVATPGIAALVERAAHVQPAVAALSIDERLELAGRSRDALADEAPVILEAALRESGQTIRFARRELDSALALLDTLPAFAEAIRPRAVPAVTGETILEWAPYGVVFGWHAGNSPVWVPTVVAASAVVAGNSVICRPSRRVRETTGRVLTALGSAWPAGAIQIAEMPPQDAEGLVVHPDISVVVAHGSTATCRRHFARLADAYAQGTPLRPYIPEASGNDAAIVLAGADLPAAAAAIAVGAFTNAGQLCMSAKRIIVESRVWSEFRPLLVREVEALRIGDPAREETDIAPLGDSPGRGRARTSLAEALALGGEIIAGTGEDGPFFTPTVVLLPRSASATMLWSEESFAPLRGLMLAADPDDAVTVANADSHGLGASVFGPADVVVGRLRAARIVVNEHPLYQDPHFVVGGIGDSGLFGARPKLEQLVYARRVHRAGTH